MNQLQLKRRTAMSAQGRGLAVFLLALLLGRPEESVPIFQELERLAWAREEDIGDDFIDVVRPLLISDSVATGATLEGAQQLMTALSSPRFPTDAALVRHWLPRVARFDFEIGHLVRPQD